MLLDHTNAAKNKSYCSVDPDGNRWNKYSKFVPILVKAIQEQNALIEALTHVNRNIRRIR